MTAPTWHTTLWDRLQQRRQRQAMPHALLLAGPEGLGKRAFAQRLIRGLLCERPVDGEGCGECRACRLVAAGTHPDQIALGLGMRKDGTPRIDIVVDQIRELSSRLAMRSQFGGWQIACIDPADAMNVAAANALLKTLEEPAEQTLLLLVADQPWRLPQTIRSRCQRIEFHLPAHAEAADWLRRQGLSASDAEAGLQAAAGNPGRALRWHASGELAFRREVRDDLAGLAKGQARLVEVVRRWQDQHPAQRLWFASQAVVDELRARAAGEAAPLGSRLDDHGLLSWYERANRDREQVRGPLRLDLMLLELLSTWR
ncbi:DNA polymerase III subunit delta' [Frateuria aurantia]